MRTHKYIEFFKGEIAIRKNLETGNYQVVENIPTHGILVWNDYGNTAKDLEDAETDARKLASGWPTMCGFAARKQSEKGGVESPAK